MDPVLKTYLDTAGNYNTKPGEQAEALRAALARAGTDGSQLAESLAYILRTYRAEPAVSTFQAALLQQKSGPAALLGVIRNGGDLVAALSVASLREFLMPRMGHDRRLVGHIHSAINGTESIGFEAARALCDYDRLSIATIVRPGRIDGHEVGRLLSSLRLPPDGFFRECGETLLNCTESRWLEDVIRYALEHYGPAAQSWIEQQVKNGTSPPVFWRVAIIELDATDSTKLVAADLSPEQREWLRRVRLRRLKRELEYRLHSLSRSSNGTAIIVNSPLLYDPASIQDAAASSKSICTWLRSEPAEAAIRSWFDEAGLDLQRTYGSPEDSITGSLCAYLDAHAKDYEAIVDAAWRIRNPTQELQISIGYLDCRRHGRDVGGADLALILSVQADEIYKRSSFAAFQCKKVRGGSLSVSTRETDQLRLLRSFTHASCYLLYPCEGSGYDATPPIVVSARTIDGLLAGRRTRTLDRGTLVDAGRALGSYFVADLLSGWSGDERWEDPATIREVVEHGLQPVHILEVTMSVAPIDRDRQR